MDVSPLVLEEARCMFEKLIATRKRQLVKLKLCKRTINCFNFILIVGLIRSYLAMEYKSLEKGTYERGQAEGFVVGSYLAVIIGYIIVIFWIGHKYDKEKKALELEISSAEKLNMKESIEEIKRLEELKRATLKRLIPLIILFVTLFILETIVCNIEKTTPDYTAISLATSNGTVIYSNETLGNFSTVVNVL